MIESMILKYSCVFFLSIGLFSCAQGDSPVVVNENNELSLEEVKEQLFNLEREAEYLAQKKVAEEYITKNTRYNPNLVFLLDMRRPSGQFRFFFMI